MIAGKKRGPRRRGGRTGTGRMPRGLRLLADAKKELDVLARQVVFARDGKQCQRCGAWNGLQWAHIRSRRYLSTRWRLENSILLCSGCHLFWHANPLAAVEWFRDKFPERANLLRLAGRNKVDPILTRLYLEAELRKYE